MSASALAKSWFSQAPKALGEKGRCFESNRVYHLSSRSRTEHFPLLAQKLPKMNWTVRPHVVLGVEGISFSACSVAERPSYRSPAAGGATPIEISACWGSAAAEIPGRMPSDHPYSADFRVPNHSFGSGERSPLGIGVTRQCDPAGPSEWRVIRRE